MATVSLVVCVYQEGDLLGRLIQRAAGCYDDLVVVHDGPDTTGARALVEAAGGRFFERPRAYQQEPHWPFAWEQAKYDWILRLDADEFPSPELKKWLQDFQQATEPPVSVSGYTCIWPLWNGKRAVTRNWPDGRNFFFHKQRVRFVGMAEVAPIPKGSYEPLRLVLQHEPKRKSYGVRNILFRRQAYHWRQVIAQSLLNAPTQLPCWRWHSADWPAPWEMIRRHPLRHALRSLIRLPMYQCRAMLRAREWPRLSACLNPGLHHFLLGFKIYFTQKQKQKNQR